MDWEGIICRKASKISGMQGVGKSPRSTKRKREPSKGHRQKAGRGKRKTEKRGDRKKREERENRGGIIK